LDADELALRPRRRELAELRRLVRQAVLRVGVDAAILVDRAVAVRIADLPHARVRPEERQIGSALLGGVELVAHLLAPVLVVTTGDHERTLGERVGPGGVSMSVA
jgi:hypothetical protein